LKSFNWTI